MYSSDDLYAFSVFCQSLDRVETVKTVPSTTTVINPGLIQGLMKNRIVTNLFNGFKIKERLQAIEAVAKQIHERKSSDE
jgi:hypothetical protein